MLKNTYLNQIAFKSSHDEDIMALPKHTLANKVKFKEQGSTTRRLVMNLDMK